MNDDRKKPGRIRSNRPPKPEWLKAPLPGGADYNRVKGLLGAGALHTVCQEARCPNQGECWNAGTATFLILGDTCTRGCRFCAVGTAAAGTPLDPEEPEQVARAAAGMELRYVVLTSVDRDDLPDGGAGHFAATIEAVRRTIPRVRVEVLTPDFQGSHAAVDQVVAAGPEVFAHNLETVRELTPRCRDRRCSYDRSLAVLARARADRPDQVTKSGIMLGMGETPAQVRECLQDMRAAGVAIVTLGQYLQPTTRHLEVVRYVPPEEFTEFARMGRKMGFAYVASSPLVRSSYMAGEAYERALGSAGRP